VKEPYPFEDYTDLELAEEYLWFMSLQSDEGLHHLMVEIQSRGLFLNDLEQLLHDNGIQ